MPSAIVVRCPNCGFTPEHGAKECEACGSPITIPSMSSLTASNTLQLNKMERGFSSVLNNPDAKDKASAHMSLGFIYMRLGLYDKAEMHFDKAIDDCVENPDLFFTAAVCCLKGRKAFLTPRPDIDKAERYLQIAIELEPRGIYYFFWAYIRQDYYARKFFKCDPTYQDLLYDAHDYGVTSEEIAQLFETLKVERPSVLR